MISHSSRSNGYSFKVPLELHGIVQDPNRVNSKLLMRNTLKGPGLNLRELALAAAAALQHTDVNLTAEAASIFNGTLKAYQKIGANV